MLCAGDARVGRGPAALVGGRAPGRNAARGTSPRRIGLSLCPGAVRATGARPRRRSPARGGATAWRWSQRTGALHLDPQARARPRPRPGDGRPAGCGTSTATSASSTTRPATTPATRVALVGRPRPHGRRPAVAWNLVDGVHDAPVASERTVWVDGEPREVRASTFAEDLSSCGRPPFHASGRARESTIRTGGCSATATGNLSGTSAGGCPGGLRLARATASWRSMMCAGEAIPRVAPPRARACGRRALGRACRAQRPARPARPTVAAAGDLLIHSPVAARALAHGGGPGYDFAPLFRPVSRWIEGADLALCHVETPLVPGPVQGYPSFRTPPDLARSVRVSGWDVCSTASNHSLDAGQHGVDRRCARCAAPAFPSTAPRARARERRRTTDARGCAAPASRSWPTPRSRTASSCRIRGRSTGPPRRRSWPTRARAPAARRAQ